MTEPFLFTVPSGEPVDVEPFHYAIVGQTQFSGKTTLIKRLSKWAVGQGFKVLIFDTKETVEDYPGFGREIPVCLRETTDSFVLIGLLESLFRRRLTRYYATLSRITEGTTGFDDIIENAKELEHKTRSSWLKDACRVLYDLLERLKNETAKVEAVPQLKLYPGINRMVINDFSLEAQQLIVKNAFEDLLRVYKRNTIGILDEAFKFIPQGYSSPATISIMQVMTQGAKTRLFSWLSTQFLAVTDKGPLKACPFKFLGTQDHTTEIKHTLDLIPEVRGKYSSDDIMRLKLGHWILVRKRPPDVRIVYALPNGVPSHVGHKVAVGELTPEQVRDEYLVPKLKEVDEELWKEKYEELKREFDVLAKDHELSEKRLRELEAETKALQLKVAEPKEIEKLRNELEQLKKSNKNLRGWKDKLIEQVGELEKENAALKEEVEVFRNFKSAFATIFPETRVQIPAEVASEITVREEVPALTVEVIRKPVVLSSQDLHGKIAIIYAEGQLPKDKWFTITTVTKAFHAHGWKRDPRTSKALDEFCRWGLFEKRYAGKRPEYRLKLSPHQAREKGLLKIHEITEN